MPAENREGILKVTKGRIFVGLMLGDDFSSHTPEELEEIVQYMDAYYAAEAAREASAEGEDDAWKPALAGDSSRTNPRVTSSSRAHRIDS